MNVGQSILEALESLTSNKLRSGLTVLGIVIGVAAVIAMLGIGSGTQSAITEQINNIGTNLLFITPGGEVDNPQPLTLQDAQAIANPKTAPSVAYVAPVLQGQVEATTPGYSTNSTLMGITPVYFTVQPSVKIAEGSFITDQQVQNYSAVAVIGTDVATALFNRTTNLVGQKIRLGSQILTVVGVLQTQGGTAFGSADNRILVPLSTAQVRLLSRSTPGEVDMIYVQARNSDAVTSATDEVTQILRARHQRNPGKQDFDIRSTQSFLTPASTITGTMTAFLGGVAGISLLVGGIGIMNIMLVSVVERTREIGLRKALGARKLDILVQFLIESGFLSLSGGLIGIALGWGIALIIGRLASLGGTPIQPVIRLNAILLATLFSAAVGVFFGLYPANRAASLEPVEALRTE
jgi:putative ABC transport system permease protein